MRYSLKSGLFAGIVILMFAACQASEDSEPESANGYEVAVNTVHPTPENLPQKGDSRYVQIDAPDGFSTGPLNLVKDTLLVIGLLEGDPNTMFGRLQDMALGPDGNMFVLDASNNEVRVFDAAGQFRYTIGGPGEGPGEFQYPDAVDVNQDGIVMVVDRMRRITLFQPGDDGYTLLSHISLDFQPADGCLLGDAIYVRGYSEANEGVLHQYSLAGEHIRSFGEAYISQNAFIRQDLSSRGYVACSEETGMVASYMRYIPVVTGYSADGAVVWQSHLTEFKPASVVEGMSDRGTPSIQFSVPADGENMFWGLAPAKPNGFIVQYMTQTEIKGWSVFQLDAQSGVGTPLGRMATPAYGMDESRIWTLAGPSFPQVLVASRR